MAQSFVAPGPNSINMLVRPKVTIPMRVVRGSSRSIRRRAATSWAAAMVSSGSETTSSALRMFPTFPIRTVRPTTPSPSTSTPEGSNVLAVRSITSTTSWWPR